MNKTIIKKCTNVIAFKRCDWCGESKPLSIMKKGVCFECIKDIRKQKEKIKEHRKGIK
jgi:hypothetical protein